MGIAKKILPKLPDYEKTIPQKVAFSFIFII